MEEEEDESSVSPCVKYLLFFLNFILWLAGWALIAVGAWALATKELEKLKVASSAFDYLFDVTIIMLILGFLIVIVSTAGCIGALRENVYILKAFWTMMILAILCFLTIGIVGLALHSYLLGLIKEHLSQKVIKNYFDDPDLKDITNFIQENFQCCGMSDEGFKDWFQYNEYYNCSEGNKKINYEQACGVPESCCVDKVKYATVFGNSLCGHKLEDASYPEARERIYILGCVSKVMESARGNIFIISGIALGLSIIPMVQICLAVTLSSQIEDQKRKWNRRINRPPVFL